LTAFCFAGFGTDRLRRAEVMKTAGRESPNRWGNASSNRVHGAEVQNRSCSIMWAAKQENFQPTEMCFFLTSPFIELIRSSVQFLDLFCCCDGTHRFETARTTTSAGLCTLHRSFSNADRFERIHHASPSSRGNPWKQPDRKRLSF
jgi:hypothetical protein